MPLGSKIQLKRSDSTAGLNETALLIENSGGGATLGKGGIIISDGHYAVAGSNGTAVRFVNSDGVRFKKSFMFVNPSPEVALTGIALDAGSDRNLFLSNTWTDPEADETPYSDAGTGNCGKGNNFAVPTCP